MTSLLGAWNLGKPTTHRQGFTRRVSSYNLRAGWKIHHESMYGSYWKYTTSHDRWDPPNGGLVREIPLFHRLVNYNLARLVSLLEGNYSKIKCVYIYIHSFHLSGFNNSIYNDCMGPLWRYPKPAKKHPFSHLSLPIFRLTTAFKRGKAWIGTMIQNLGVVWSEVIIFAWFVSVIINWNIPSITGTGPSCIRRGWHRTR